MEVLIHEEGAQDVIDVVDSRVPIIKMEFNGFQIDLLYAAIDP